MVAISRRLFKLKTEERTEGIYARNLQDIIDLIQFYNERDGEWTGDPDVRECFRRVPTAEDIEEVEKGIVYFQIGMVDARSTGDFFEELKVADDFSFYVNHESLTNFALFRTVLPRMRRANLYKVQIDGGMFSGLYFIPQDVAEATMAYDLTSHIERARNELERLTEVKRGHPNIR